MNESKGHYIVVVGCGRMGSYIANKLSGHGHSVVVIDRSAATFSALTAEFSGFTVEGDATRREVWNQVKMEHADVLIATTHDDNVNLMVAQAARILYRVPKVLARVYDPRREEVYARLGIDTVCPTTIAAWMLIGAVEGGHAPVAEGAA